MPCPPRMWRAILQTAAITASKIFSKLKRAAAEDGFTLILDGTNASDDAGDRPVCAPCARWTSARLLRECGLTKAEIRRLSHEAGLFTWGQARLCLPCHARPHRHAHHAGAAGRHGARRGLAVLAGLHGSPRPPAGRLRLPAVPGRSAFPGTGPARRDRRGPEARLPGSSASIWRHAMHNFFTALFTQVRDGSTSVADAVLQLREAPFEDLGYARVDSSRRPRAGRSRGHLRRGQNAGADRWHRRFPAAQRTEDRAHHAHEAGGRGLSAGARSAHL